MFSKLLNFIIIYILTIINFFVILMPLTFLISINLIYDNKIFDFYVKTVFYSSVVLISFLMIIFLFFNYMFSLTVRYYRRKCINCENDDKYLLLNKIFQQVKDRFNKQNVVLLLKKSSEINAYAVGGFRKNCIVLTEGIIDLYVKKSDGNRNNFALYIKAILGHEMSHIVNKDFLPALLLIINEKAVNFVSYFMYIIFVLLTKIVSIVPYIGFTISNIIIKVYNIINIIITFFYKYIFMNFYKMIQLQISRNIEYRADLQGAKLCGGVIMSEALFCLGKSGFFSIFSTHPSTQNRVKMVKNIKSTDSIIRPVLFSNFATLFSFILLIFLFFYSVNLIEIDKILSDCRNTRFFVYNLIAKFVYYKNSLMNYIISLN